MAVTTTQEERGQQSGLERSGVSTQNQQDDTVRKTTNVICFACRTKLALAESHVHPYPFAR